MKRSADSNLESPSLKLAKADEKSATFCTEDNETVELRRCLAGDLDTKIPCYRASYVDVALPFPACAMDGLFDEKFLRQAREEAIANLEASLKESDLYEKLQSVDLALLSAESPDDFKRDMPHLQKIYSTLQSDLFKEVLSAVSGVPTASLQGTVDSTIHIYGEGHHLLIHDDDVGSRKIAFIIYLNDPDDPWTTEDGGCLELYALDGKVPKNEPTTMLLPKWNRMSIFEVLPSRSWHAVEEMRNPEKLRLSIQGWFHSTEDFSDREQARPSVSEIIAQREALFEASAVALPDPDYAFPDPKSIRNESSVLTEEDVETIGKLLNPNFGNRKTIQLYREEFIERNCILNLKDFLREDVFAELRKGCLATAEDTRGPIIGPPTFHRYQRLNDYEHPLVCLANEFFMSDTFRRLILEITGFEIAGKYLTEPRRFRRGQDYVLAVAPSPGDRLDATFVLVDDDNAEKRTSWKAGEVGGMEVLVPALSNDGAQAEVAADDGEALIIETVSNSLSIMLRPSEVPAVRYVKFLKTSAPSDRFEVHSEFPLIEADVTSSIDDEEGEVERQV